MSALPPALASADEVDVLESLARLLAAGEICPAQVRKTYVAWKVERDQQYYARFEIVRPWSRKEAA